MPADAAHKSWWQISELVFGLPFLASIALQLVMPILLPDVFHKPLIILIGSILILTGLAFIVLARREMAKFNQPTDPGRPTSTVVTSGVFSISRNPLYLGATCLLIGIALVARLTWFFILLLPTLLACHYILIAPEERYLSTKFGEEYTRYTLAVYRWIGVKRITSEHQDLSAH